MNRGEGVKPRKPQLDQTTLLTVQSREEAGPLGLSTAAFMHIRLFLALSRTAHGLMDMATPALAALIWLGTFPPAHIFWLGIVTAFAGYTSVYALNDLVDWRTDAKRFEEGLISNTPDDLDSVLIRHPIASGKLSMAKAILWTSWWMVITLIGAFMLNPVCLLIFIIACILEALYCLAWKSTWFKVLLSGIVKTSGAVAAIYAVDGQPSHGLLVTMFFWIFFWEIGGQNIPNDWSDIEEDRILKASTIPVAFGLRVSVCIILACLVATVGLSCIVLVFSPLSDVLIYAGVSIGVGFYFLLLPGLNLYRKGTRSAALALFNHASYYPICFMMVVVAGLLIRSS